MKMKTLLIIFAFLISLPALAQPPRDGEKLEALKIAFLTRKLNLSAEEAKKFWPSYNQYTEDMKKVRLEGRGGDELEREEKLLAIRKKYQAEFGKSLSPDKANQFFKAEKEFYQIVQKELMERRQQRQELRRRPNDNR